ncbi:MAG: hypothetical protein WBO17_07965 [Sphingorhabdus sp.]
MTASSVPLKCRRAQPGDFGHGVAGLNCQANVQNDLWQFGIRDGGRHLQRHPIILKAWKNSYGGNLVFQTLIFQAVFWG